MALDLSQEVVAAKATKAGYPMTKQTVSQYESGGRAFVSRRVVMALALALDCTVTYLLGLTGNPKKWVPDRPWHSDQPISAILAADTDTPGIVSLPTRRPVLALVRG